MDISDFSLNHKDELRKFLREAKQKTTSDILFSTHDEMMGQACFFLAAKDQFANPCDAFVTFWSREYQLTQDDHSPSDFLEIELFNALSSNSNHNIKKITTHQWDAETHLVLSHIKKILRQVQEGGLMRHGKTVRYSQMAYDLKNTDTYWGIYVNRKIIKDIDEFLLPISGEILDAVSFQQQWNDIVFMAETSHQYIYFSWHTGA